MNEDNAGPLTVIDGGETQVAGPMCTCCATPVPLALSTEENMPFAFCLSGRKIYELQATGGYAITDYVLESRRIVDPATGRIIFPKNEVPAQEELLQRAREDSGGSKPIESGNPGRVNLGDAEYW